MCPTGPEICLCRGFVPDSAIENICMSEAFKVRCQTHKYSTYAWKKLNFSLSVPKIRHGVEQMALISTVFLLDAWPRLHLCSLLDSNTLDYLVMAFLLQAMTNAASSCLHMVISDGAEMCVRSQSSSPLHLRWV